MKYFIPVVLIFLSITLFAQEKKTYNLGEVVVTSQKENITEAATVNELEGKDLSAKDAVVVSKLLSFIPGIYSLNNSRNEDALYIRGFEQREVSVFIDGVPVYSPYDGYVDLGNLFAGSVEKVTVTKSMPSVLYGPNSMGGTINIVTNEPGENISGNVSLSGGARKNAAGNISGIYGNLRFAAGAEYAESESFELPEDSPSLLNEDGGERDNSGYINRGGFLKVGYRQNGVADFAYTYMLNNNSKDIPTDARTEFPRYWRFGEWNKNLHNLMFTTLFSGDFTVKGNFFYETFYNVLDSYDDATFSTQERRYAFHSVYDDYSYGTNLTLSADLGLHGVTKAAFLYKRDVHTESGNFNEPFAEYKADNITLGIEQDINISEGIDGVAGYSFDILNPVYANGGELRESESTNNIHAGLSYTVSEKVRLYGNIAGRSRFPTLKEFYSETAGRDVANPDLKTERSLNTELGLVYAPSAGLSVRGAFYYSDVTDLIQQVDLPERMRQYQNIGDVILSGFEAGASYSREHLSADFNYTYLYSENRSAGAENENLEYRPEHIFNMSAGYEFPYRFMLLAESVYTGKYYGVNSNNYELEEMGDYLLLNLRLSKVLFEKYTLFIRGDNLTDKYYESKYGYPQPGREFIFGIKADW